MSIRLRMALAGAGTAALAIAGVAGLTGMASATQAQGAGSGGSQRVVLTAGLAPSVPTDPEVFGVTAGSIPWVIEGGHARLGSGGALQVNVAGLVDPRTGKNPVPGLAASVYCNGTLAATTSPVPFSPQGNASLHAMITLPAFCPAPAVLLNPATGTTAADVHSNVYIAFDGTAGQ